MEEMFDQVDAEDRPIAQVPRSVVHARNLLHRSVHVLVFDGRGHVFLQKRSMSKDQCPGMWGTSCAGHVDAGEEYDSAARREYLEELGVEPPELEKVAKLAPSRQTGYEFVWIYRCTYEGAFILNPEEIERGEWLPVAGLAEMMAGRPREYTPSLRRVWDEYMAVSGAC